MSNDVTQMGDEITITLIRNGETLHTGAVAEATENSEETDNEE